MGGTATIVSGLLRPPLEELHLAKALFRFFERLVRAAKVSSFTGYHLIAAFHVFDHRASLE